jgi:YidC/Oxa1 family membrane protein insertase
MQQAKNWIAFIVVAVVVSVLWLFVLPRWFGPKTPPADNVAKTSSSSPSEESSKSGSSSSPASSSAKSSSEGSPSSSGSGQQKPRSSRTGPVLEQPPPPLKDSTVYHLGGDGDYNIAADFTTRGGGMRGLTLTRFEAADGEGRPLLKDGKAVPLHLIPDDETTPSFLMYLYPENEDRPLDTLGKVEWKFDRQWEDDDGQHIRFQYEYKSHGLLISKIFTLKPKVYDVRLQVKIEATADAKGKAVPVQYQLTGAHGLPIEGGWYTSVFRNAVIGPITSDGTLRRNLQDLKKISHGLGGTPVERGPDARIVYGGVVVQYFGSVVCIDQDQKDKDFIERVQPTVESLALRGTFAGRTEFRSGSEEPETRFFDLKGEDKELHHFLLPDAGWGYPITWSALDDIKPGDEVVVRYRLDEKAEVAMEIITKSSKGNAFEQLHFDDITVRLVTTPIAVKEDQPIVQEYVLYNGPVKVALLRRNGVSGSLERPPVSSEVVDNYENHLHLDTLTDAPFPNWISENIFHKIGWTSLLIWCTNRIHGVLYFLHTYIMPWNYGLCIILLTVMVRGLMFPLSRKQAMMSLKMQALAPEVKKLQEKHKDDRQALQLAMMDLYRKHGVNPLGTCWVALLQMPIFLGLYYALQESVDLRLAGFLWIKNLAAPDMLWRWGSRIPIISTPSSFGGWFFLGPYLNVLPIIAVALMIVQQKYMMPPAQDEQQATQQKMMKFMMIIMGLLFYKVAAGLGLYFITSSLWGFAERKLLPKKKILATPAPGAEPKPGLLHRLMMQMEAGRKGQSGDGAGAAQRTAVTSTPAGRRKRRSKQPEDTEPRSWFQGMKDWWSEILKKAEKK